MMDMWEELSARGVKSLTRVMYDHMKVPHIQSLPVNAYDADSLFRALVLLTQHKPPPLQDEPNHALR